MYGCVDKNHHGNQCQFECSDVCENKMCDASTGACLTCGIAKFGENCDEGRLLRCSLTQKKINTYSSVFHSHKVLWNNALAECIEN